MAQGRRPAADSVFGLMRVFTLHHMAPRGPAAARVALLVDDNHSPTLASTDTTRIVNGPGGSHAGLSLSVDFSLSANNVTPGMASGVFSVFVLSAAAAPRGRDRLATATTHPPRIDGWCVTKQRCD